MTRHTIIFETEGVVAHIYGLFQEFPYIAAGTMLDCIGALVLVHMMQDSDPYPDIYQVIFSQVNAYIDRQSGYTKGCDREHMYNSVANYQRAEAITQRCVGLIYYIAESLYRMNKNSLVSLALPPMLPVVTNIVRQQLFCTYEVSR